MTAATAALSFAATSGIAPVAKSGTERLRAPCLGLAVVVGSGLWVGIGSTVLLLVA